MGNGLRKAIETGLDRLRSGELKHRLDIWHLIALDHSCLVDIRRRYRISPESGSIQENRSPSLTNVKKTEARVIDPVAQDQLEDFGGEMVDRGHLIVDGEEYKRKFPVLVCLRPRPCLNVGTASKTSERREITARETLGSLREREVAPSAPAHHKC